jgi:hypothetical protein
VYDALLEWCRDGQGESHGWPAHELRPEYSVE